MSDYQASGVAESNMPGGADSGGMGVYTPTQQSQAPSQPKMPEYSYDLNSVNPEGYLGYKTFLGGYGYDKTSAQSQANYKNQSLAAQLAQGLPGFETERKEGVLNANESAGQRGAIRSSSNLLSQDNVVRDVNTKESAFRQGIADQQAQTAFGLQDTLNQLEQSRAQQELQARQAMLQQQNQQIAYQRAASQYGIDPSLASMIGNGYNG